MRAGQQQAIPGTVAIADPATQVAVLEGDGEPILADDGPLTLDDILSAENLVDLIDESVLAGIGADVVRDYEIDLQSRKDEGWEEKNDRAMRIAMQVRKAKNTPWPGASNVKLPILTVACIGFNARAYPVIVDGSNLVKGRVLGPDPDGAKRDRADRIGQHMSWQLLYRMPGWEEDTDKLLLMLPITGAVIRKTYFDEIANANVSAMLPAADFVVNYWAKSLETAPRFTHRLRFYPHEVRERVLAGLWRDVHVEPRAEDANDEAGQVEFLEQHRFLDLDEDGAPEPYVVTTTMSGEVARIVPCFGPEDVTVALRARVKGFGRTARLGKLIEAGMAELVGEIVRVERRQYFTKYGFIPAPDGSFYDIGYGFLLDDITASIDTSINQMMDSGTIQNMGGGLIGNGVNMRSGEMRIRMNSWTRVDVTGGDLAKNIVPFQHAGPSQVLFALLELLIGWGERITSTSDVMSGEVAPNTPATTTLAAVEQATKIVNAIFKRIHRSFGKELRVLRGLNRDYLDEEEYFQLNDSDPEAQAIRVGRQDYQDADLDVVPVSDPSQASETIKLARSDAEWMSFNGDPLVNQVELRRRRMEALRVPDPKTMLKVPEPAPDPKVLIEGMKEARAKIETAGKVAQMRSAAAEKMITGAERLFALGMLEDAASLVAIAKEIAGEADGDGDVADRSRGVPQMAGPAGDGGILPDVGEPAGGPDGGMGEGLRDGAGMPAGGADADVAAQPFAG